MKVEWNPKSKCHHLFIHYNPWRLVYSFCLLWRFNSPRQNFWGVPQEKLMLWMKTQWETTLRSGRSKQTAQRRKNLFKNERTLSPKVQNCPNTEQNVNNKYIYSFSQVAKIKMWWTCISFLIGPKSRLQTDSE